MYILDGNLLKCNPLQATVANPHRAATECAETHFGGVTTGPLYFQLKGPAYTTYLDKSQRSRRDLTSGEGGLEYRQFPAKSPAVDREPAPGFMTPSSPSELPEKKSNRPPCEHPRVQIVAREEDSEFVECKECGEIFESSEFKDMIIEDTKLPKES